MPRRIRIALLAAAAVITVGAPSPALAAVPTITIDAAQQRGFVRPTTVGQMMEWALDDMNGAWAEKLAERSLEAETVLSRRSTLYDAFTGSSLDRSRWTPLSLDSAPAGTVSVASSTVTVAAAANGRFGIMSNDVLGSRYAGYEIEAKVSSFTGQNVLLTVYGGTGAGDHTKFVEFGIEAGVLKVFADGVANWGGADDGCSW